MKEYYQRRASEYDETSYEAADAEEVAELARLGDVIGALPPGRTLDVACGTGFLTRYLQGEIVGLDQSEEMLRLARERVPRASFVRGDAIPLPFPDDSFDRVFTSNFYGHLEPSERRSFLAEARRVARELVIVDCAWAPGRVPEGPEERILRDGSRWAIHKCYFTPDVLLGELGGADLLFHGPTFLAARKSWSPPGGGDGPGRLR
jgi:SAM-dependent methyltransferase